MRIAGLQKLTLLDYPEKTAATVFTLGCNFRCPFCHNAELVTAKGHALAQPMSACQSAQAANRAPLIPEEEILSFLETRQGLLDAVCITGGEPTLQKDLAPFCQAIKERGFLVKLDTNGSNPHVLCNLLERKLIDYVALDVKNAPERYGETCGRAGGPNDDGVKALLANVQESMALVLRAAIPFELRTTVADPLHTEESLLSCARWINQQAHEAGKSLAEVAWYLQQFVDSENVLAGQHQLFSWEKGRLERLMPLLQEQVPRVSMRGSL